MLICLLTNDGMSKVVEVKEEQGEFYEEVFMNWKAGQCKTWHHVDKPIHIQAQKRIFRKTFILDSGIFLYIEDVK